MSKVEGAALAAVVGMVSSLIAGCATAPPPPAKAVSVVEAPPAYSPADFTPPTDLELSFVVPVGPAMKRAAPKENAIAPGLVTRKRRGPSTH